MSAGGALGASLFAVLVHPRWWLLAGAAFLVRGGLLLLFLPMIQLPTTAGLANALGPTLVGFVFGGPSTSFLVLVGAIVGGLALWLAIGGLAGAALDLDLVRQVAADEELRDRERPMAGDPWAALLVRWLAHLPTVLVIAWGAAPLVDAAYAELIHPGDPHLPVALRVVLRVPEIVGLLVVAWVAGEAGGGLAVRHLAWGAGVRGSLVRAAGSLLRPSALAVLVLTNAGLTMVILVGGLAVWAAFDHVRIVLREDALVLVQWVGFALLSAAWLGAAWLVSLAAAWRAAAWTFEIGRRRPTSAIDPERV